jgi:stearoyl-CoA desaturase (delta-9 desaturase)
LKNALTEPRRKDRIASLDSPKWDPEAAYFLNIGYFSVLHLLPFGAFLSGVNASSIVACVALYFVRIFFITAGYHCYFSHRAFKTSRTFQLLLAIGAQTSGQGSVLKWAAMHRYHHANADSGADLHSPRHKGFWYSHMGWLLNQRYEYLTSSLPKYLTKFPELMWLHRYYYLPTIVLAALVWAVLGWPGLFLSYGLSTVLCFHATFCVNSVTHMFGTRRFDTPDDSRNNWFVALVMLGGGWHNNHHRYPRSARQGIFWWEIDITYYLVRALALLHAVWDLQQPPARTFLRTGAGPSGGVERFQQSAVRSRGRRYTGRSYTREGSR